MALALEGNPKKKSTELTLQIVCSRSIIYTLGRHTMFGKACVSANGSDVYFEAERSLPKCAWNCEK